MQNEAKSGFVGKVEGANPSTSGYSTSAAARIRTWDLPVNSRPLQPTKLRRHLLEE